MKIGAVIVAAGMSSRMKAFKPLLPLCGSTVIGTAIASLRSAGISEIAVVTGNQAEKLEGYLSGTGVTCLFNEKYETTDMFESAKIGLDYMKGRSGRMFFLPGDVPLFSKRSLKLMNDVMDRGGCKILSPTHCGQPGHPILIDSGAVASLVSYDGGGGLKGAIDCFQNSKKSIELDDAGMTLDADTPLDYERLKSYADSDSYDMGENYETNQNH